MKAADTNILVRYIVEDDEEQVRKALNFLTRDCSAADPCFVNRIVLSEIVWVLETAYRYTRARVVYALERLLQTYQLLIEDRTEALVALNEYRRGADFNDVFLAEINRRVGCDYTATFDRKAARRPGFRLL